MLVSRIPWIKKPLNASSENTLNGMAELWPETNERGKLECADCHSEFTNPIAFINHSCYPDVREVLSALATE